MITRLDAVWRWLAPALVLGCSFVILWQLINAADGFVSNDDYYHAGIAAQIGAQGRLRVDFPWLPYSILSPERFVDHHLLYHLYLMPWVMVGGMAGAKLAQVSVISALFAVFYELLRRVGCVLRWCGRLGCWRCLRRFCIAC
jgi:hypothetical protein